MQIDSNIPVPEVRIRHRGRVCKYPWADMKVGDSFAAEAVGPNATSRTYYYRALAQSWAKRNSPDAEFVSAVHNNTIRVWRLR